LGVGNIGDGVTVKSLIYKSYALSIVGAGAKWMYIMSDECAWEKDGLVGRFRTWVLTLEFMVAAVYDRFGNVSCWNFRISSTIQMLVRVARRHPLRVWRVRTSCDSLV
jgi:hypothetical protein